MNFGGGGGRGKVLGGDEGILLIDGWTNFCGAGIVKVFLTPKSDVGSPDFKKSDPCNEF